MMECGQTYREFAPPPDLRRWVDCLWVREAAAIGAHESPHSHLVVPDGCLDILFERAGTLAETAYVAGMMTRPLWVRRTDQMSIVAVRFHPGGAAAFFREPLESLTDARIPLVELWRGSRHLAERLSDDGLNGRAIDAVTSELRLRLQPVSSTRLTACDAAIALMRADPAIQVAALCTELGISRQALAASFREYVGISPRQLGRILRFQRALRLATAYGSDRKLPWARLAQDAGFYDQSHLINEFQALTGATPRSLLTEPGASFPNFQD